MSLQESVADKIVGTIARAVQIVVGYAAHVLANLSAKEWR